MIAKKELGQNFLIDPNIISDLVEASDPQPGDVYLEIGPGQGAVTQTLAKRVKKVIAVELDGEIIPYLKQNLKELNNVEIIHADVLAYLSRQLSAVSCQFSKIIGSIPYQITSPLLHSLAKLSLTANLGSITLLIQKEVAEKILAQTPDASYLSNFIQNYFDLKFVVNVSRESFQPVPKVDGAIVKLKVRSEKSKIDPEKWSQFLHRGFKFPRKMIKKSFDEKMLILAGVKPTQRPQELTSDRWIKLYKLYGKEEL